MIAAADFTDPENARVILLAAGGLVALAVLLTVGTVWWWRTSKVEHPALGPLEVMSSRRWAAAGPHEQEAQLAEVRPDGEVERPVRPSRVHATVVTADDAEPDLGPTEDEVEVERDLDHYDDRYDDRYDAPALFDQDLLDPSESLPAPEVPPPSPGAPVDPLLAPRPPQ